MTPGALDDWGEFDSDYGDQPEDLAIHFESAAVVAKMARSVQQQQEELERIKLSRAWRLAKRLQDISDMVRTLFRGSRRLALSGRNLPGGEGGSGEDSDCAKKAGGTGFGLGEKGGCVVGVGGTGTQEGEASGHLEVGSRTEGVGDGISRGGGKF